jgi:uncharacterized integral membrane protein
VTYGVIYIMGASLEEQIAGAGIHYPRSYDIAYRAGFVLQSAGAVLFTALYILGKPFYPLSLAVFEAGVALSGVFLLVWNASVKRFILGCLVLGFIAQGAGLLSPYYGEKIFLIGLGFVLAAGAGIMGKEAYCFGYLEGWALLASYPIALLPNLFASGPPGDGLYGFNAAMALIITLLHLSFLRRKLSQPLLRGCESGVCGLPESGKGRA